MQQEKQTSNGIYLVYGWKIPKSAVTHLLADMKPEATDIGFRIVFPANRSQHVAVGFLLASVFPGKDAMVSATPPHEGMREQVYQAMEIIGLVRTSKETPPQLFLVSDCEPEMKFENE